MEFDSSNYQKCVIESFKLKSNVFYQLVQKYNHSLSSHVDDSFYSSIGFIIGIIQDNLQSTNSKTENQANYDFYKDSNIPEVLPTIGLLNRLEQRVLDELQQWPDHPALKDVSSQRFRAHIKLKLNDKSFCFFLDIGHSRSYKVSSI